MSASTITPRQTSSGGVGHSADDDAATVARDAVRMALGDRTPAAGDLVFIFPNADYDLDELLAAAMDAAAPAQVVGATTCGAFTHEATVPHGCVAIHLPGDDLRIGVCHAERDDDDIAGSTRRTVETARDRAGEEHPFSVLVLLCDGLTPDQRAMARGAFEVTGALVPMVGGTAGDDLAWQRTSTFGEGTVLARGMVAVWINAERPLAVSVDHGWRPYSKPLLVTRAEGPVIHELDGRPALEVYLSECGDELRDGKSTGERVLTWPIGLPNAFGRYDMRQVHEFTDDGGIVLLTDIPEQTVLRVMTSDPDSLLAGADAAAAAALEELDEPPRLSIVFSCCTRDVLLGERLPEEVELLSSRLGGVPAAGFLTCGEFARVPGSTGIHNSSVALLTL